MSQQCDICGKRLQRGNNISHAHNVSHRIFKPNLQKIHVIVDGTSKTVKACTRCIRTGNIVKRTHHKQSTS